MNGGNQPLPVSSAHSTLGASFTQVYNRQNRLVAVKQAERVRVGQGVQRTP